MPIIPQVLREKWFENDGFNFAHSQTTNKLVNEATNDSARVSEQDRKIPPALGTIQIAGFGGFCPLASLEKNKNSYKRYLANEKLRRLESLRGVFVHINTFFHFPDFRPLSLKGFDCYF